MSGIEDPGISYEEIVWQHHRRDAGDLSNELYWCPETDKIIDHAERRGWPFSNTTMLAT